MRHRLALLGIAGTGLLALSSTLSAWPMQEQFPTNRGACYERIYDGTHLAKHPKQDVTRITLNFEPDLENLQTEQKYKLRLDIDIEVRGKKDIYTLGGFCQVEAKGVLCTPEWDAGTFSVISEKDGTLLVTNHNMTFNPNNYDAEDVAPNAIQLTGDDKTWRLSPGGKHCRDAAIEKKPEMPVVPNPH
jgi:hypothetical protein